MAGKKAVFILLLASILLMAPAFLLGAGGADLHAQSLWTRNFSRQLWEGELYPRWLQGMFAGDGSPVFFYYPPVSYYFTSLFSFLGSLDAFGYYPIAASALVATFLSGLAFYVWAMDESNDPDSALIASILYLCIPNHIGVNFYQFLMLSSLWAYVWIPLLMLFAHRLGMNRTFGLPGFAGMLGLLILTNLPMTAMFGPLAVAYALWSSSRKTMLHHAMRILAGTMLGFGLAALYLLPCALYMSAANINLHWQDFGSDYVYSGSEFFLDTHTLRHILCSLYLATVIVTSILYYKAAQPNSLRWPLLAACILPLVMMLPQSRILWLFIPGMKLLQFPERLFAISAICIPMLIALSHKRHRFITYGLITVSLIATATIAAHTRMSIENYHKAEPLKYEHFLLGIDQYAEYLSSQDLIRRYGFKGIEELKADTRKAVVLSGDARLDLIESKPRKFTFNYQAKEPSVLRMRQFAFPGFEARLNGEELAISRDRDTGEIIVPAPPGKGVFTLELTALLPEKAGEALSLMSACLILLLALIQLRHKEQLRPI